MTHPEQTLRDKVWSVLNNVWAGDSEADLYIKTDAILDLVREALLSDEAIVAAQRGITSYVWDPENQEEIINRKMLGATRSGIKEALDSLA